MSHVTATASAICWSALSELFRRPTTRGLMQRELDDAKRGLLQALTGRDYAESMVAYQQRRIARLERDLKGLSDEA